MAEPTRSPDAARASGARRSSAARHSGKSPEQSTGLESRRTETAGLTPAAHPKVSDPAGSEHASASARSGSPLAPAEGAGTSAAIGNRLYPPITDPYYADSLALRSHMESYDYLVSQPSVLNHEQEERMREIMGNPGKPLPGNAIPWKDDDGKP